MLKKELKINKKGLIGLLVGIFLIIFGISLIIINVYIDENQIKDDTKKLESFFKEDNILIKNTSEEKEEEKLEEEYFAVLEIPKINLKRGLFDKSSSKNNVNKNIYIVKETVLPNEANNSHIILASHSGNSSVSFFRNLKKLDINDKVFFYYEHIKYIYEIVDRYEIPKTGKAQLIQTNSSDITLITCITGTKKQVVYLGELIAKEQY